MSKSKSKNFKKKKAQTRKSLKPIKTNYTTPTNENGKKLMGIGSKIISILSLISLILSFSYFIVKIDVSASQTTGKDGLFNSSIEVHNASNFYLTNVKMALKLDSVSFTSDNMPGSNIGFNDSYVSNTSYKTDLIRENEYWTNPIPFKGTVELSIPNPRIKHANVLVILTFRYLWLDLERRFRLIGNCADGANMTWQRQPE